MDKHQDNQSHEHLSADRLIEAAEAAMAAMKENAEFTGGAGAYPLDLLGSPVQPACLAPFTRYEIEQACEFLVRMGELDAPSRKRAA